MQVSRLIPFALFFVSASCSRETGLDFLLLLMPHNTVYPLPPSLLPSFLFLSTARRVHLLPVSFFRKSSLASTTRAERKSSTASLVPPLLR